MFRIIVLIVWVLLSAWLLIWVGEGLFGVDQSTSILPFYSGDGLTAPIMIGVAWGIILTLGGLAPGTGRRSKPRGETAIPPFMPSTALLPSCPTWARARVVPNGRWMV